MPKKRKYRKYTDEFIKEVLEYKESNSYTTTAEKFNIPRGTIRTWIYQNRLVVERSERGRKKEATIEVKYEILKKFHDFLEQQNDKS